MKIYCSCCDKVQPVQIDNCRDAKTNEPFQDIVCAECNLVIASGTGIAPPPRKPLTDEMVKRMKENCTSMEMRGAFADGWLSAEAAHGIKGEA